jgi:uncharacterized protein with HEPN domain
MANPDDTLRLAHMRDAAQKALHFCQGKNRNELDENELLCLALVRLLEIIGEAGSKVSQETRDKFPSVPWPKIIGMRNRLVHRYDQIDLEVLWQTLMQDLQPLINALQKTLETK